MRRTLPATLIIAAIISYLLTGTVRSEGHNPDAASDPLVATATSGVAETRDSEPVSRFVELAKRYAETLPVEELESELAAMEAKLREAQAARQLRSVRAELETIVREYPDTEAAKAATKMLQEPPRPQGQPVPHYGDPTPISPGDGLKANPRSKGSTPDVRPRSS